MFRDLIESLRRLVTGNPIPAYVLVRSEDARRCPDCGTAYGAGERYCPGCRATAPEWRFG
jgi:hypothetical protein